MEQQNGSFWIGDWHVRPSLNRIERSGETEQVEPRIMDVLVCLAEQPGEVVPRERLIESVWPDTFVGDDPLNRAISELRKVFDDNPRDPQYIETIRKTGYRLIAPVTEAPNEVAASPSSEGAEPAAVDDKLLPTWAWGGVIVLIVLVGAAWLWRSQRAAPPTLMPRPFTSFPGAEQDPAFSADGNKVAFAWTGPDEGGFDIYVKLLDTETPLRLTRSAADDLSPVWSPDDQYLAFIRKTAETCGIYRIPAIGGAERRLADCPSGHVAADLDWSPDGAFLAFADRETLQAPYSLYLLSTETFDVRRLTTPPARFRGDDLPAFSPDGQTVAFTRTSISGVENVYLLSMEGGSPRRLTNENQRIISLTWDDRDHLIYSSDRMGTFSLWRLSLRKEEPEWLLTGGDGVRDPAVARQDGRLVYVQQVLDKNIWQVALTDDGQEAQPARLIASTRWDSSPQFSPDGQRIAFMSNRSGSYEIWMAGRDGQQPVQLTSFGRGMVGTPRWSPDGQHVAFDARTEGNADIYVLAVEGGMPQRLTSHATDEVAPSWSRDGRWVYFGSSRSGAWEVWKKPVEEGAAVQVTRDGGFAAFESLDGRTLYYTKRDQPGVWGQPVGGGGEALICAHVRADDWGNWGVADGGIYFLDRRGDRDAVSFYDVETGDVTTNVVLGTRPLANPGFAIAPDEATALYVQVDEFDSDLMLVDDVR